jgi:hypothetical protein
MELLDIPGYHDPMAAIWELVRTRLDALDRPDDL